MYKYIYTSNNIYIYIYICAHLFDNKKREGVFLSLWQLSPSSTGLQSNQTLSKLGLRVVSPPDSSQNVAAVQPSLQDLNIIKALF